MLPSASHLKPSSLTNTNCIAVGLGGTDKLTATASTHLRPSLSLILSHSRHPICPVSEQCERGFASPFQRFKPQKPGNCATAIMVLKVNFISLAGEIWLATSDVPVQGATLHNLKRFGDLEKVTLCFKKLLFRISDFGKKACEVEG